MLETIQKKIKRLFIDTINVFKKHLAYIVFVGVALQVFLYIRKLPYINIIASSSNYYYYAFVIVWTISLVIFKKRINNTFLLLGLLLLFIIGIPAAMVGITALNDIVGFFAYILLFTYVFRKVSSERNDLREDLI